MPVSIEQCRQLHLLQQSRRSKELEQKRQRILAALPKAASIARQFGAEQVFIFGSILKEKTFHGRSDLDILVIGMPLSGWLPALLAIEMVPALSNVAIDLKRSEELSQSLVELILSEGQRIIPE